MLIENNIASSKNEETVYLRQYGKGNITEAVYEMEIRRVRKYREQQEVKLAEITVQVQEYEQATYSYEQFNEALVILADRLKGADYDTKLLALEALNIQVTLQPERKITITGSIPARERVMSQTYDGALRDDLGRQYAAGRGQADKPRTGTPGRRQATLQLRLGRGSQIRARLPGVRRGRKGAAGRKPPSFYDAIPPATGARRWRFPQRTTA